MRFPIATVALLGVVSGVMVGAAQNALDVSTRDGEVGEALVRECVAKQGANGDVSTSQQAVDEGCRQEVLAQQRAHEKGRPS